MSAFLLEEKNIKQVAVPADLNGAAVTGARIKLDKRDRVAVVISFGDSVGAAVSISLQQHDAASAGNSKALSVDNPYYHKVAAATSFTKVEPGAAASSYDLASLFAGDEGVVVFEVLSEQLDNENGYDWFSINVADSTAAKIMGAVYVSGVERFKPAYSEAI